MTNNNVFRQKVLDAFFHCQENQKEEDKLGFLKYAKYLAKPRIYEVPLYPSPEVKSKSAHNWKKEGF